MPSATFRRAGAIGSAILLAAAIAPPATSQTLHDFVAAAAGRNPELAGLIARRQAIGARQYAADALTPAPPALFGSYVTDQVIRNRQQREAQLGISTPVWLPGEGTASRRLADAELSRSTAQAAVIRLRLAGQVRDGLAEFALAQAERTLAERRLRDARTLESDVGRRSQAREASDADLLLARAERIAADAQTRDRQLALEQSRLDFLSLTGMAPVAAALSEAIAANPSGEAIAANPSGGTIAANPSGGTIAANPSGRTVAANPSGGHPRLADARGAIEIARASRSLAGVQVRDSPEIGLVARRNRDIGGTLYDDSLGIEFRIPFATQARNRPRQAAAQAEWTEATALYAAAEREIGTDRRKARIGYDNAVAQRDLARQRSDALTRQTGLIARGYQGGEVSLLDYLRVRGLAYDAQATRARAEIGVAKAAGRLNQAFGVIP